MKARLAGAAALSLLAMYLLHAGGAPWPPALLFGLAAGCFTAWRTIPGSWSAFALMLAAAGLTVLEAPPRPPFALLPATVLLSLEIYGMGTALRVRTAAERRPSQRLLRAWLASTGTLWFALANLGAAPNIASALVCVALAYRMGAFPAFGWAPLLLRHPSTSVVVLGAVAFLATGVATALLIPVLPDPHATRVTLGILGAVALPYTLWHTHRQWRVDRRCARSYIAAAGASVLLLVLARML